MFVIFYQKTKNKNYWVLFYSLDILEEDLATSLLLQLHQFLNIFPLLLIWIKKIFGKIFQNHVIVTQVVRLSIERG